MGVGLRDRIRIGASGKIISAFDIARALALGADWCNSARGFMFAVGCIQSQSCHTDRCPTGAPSADKRRPPPLGGWIYGGVRGGGGRVWVSVSGGTVRDNANRWLRQFGAQDTDEAGLKALPTMPLLGEPAVVVKAEGTYQGGMGQPEQAGYGMAGVIAAYQGGVVTVKMVAPAAEVRFGFPALVQFVGSLRKVD